MKGIGTSVSPSLTPQSWTGDGQWLSEDGFLFDPVRGLTFSVNPTGAFIHRLLTEGFGASAIVDALVERFEVDAASALSDLEVFVADLRDAGLR